MALSGVVDVGELRRCRPWMAVRQDNRKVLAACAFSNPCNEFWLKLGLWWFRKICG